MISLNEGIAVDAAHSTKNRKTEFQGVDLKTGKHYFTVIWAIKPLILVSSLQS